MRKRTAVTWLVVAALLVASVYGVVLIRHGFSTRDNPSRFEAAVATSMRKLAIPAGAREQKNRFNPTPEVLREAMIHFADHCAVCHANDGSGRTAIGQNLYPKAPDMRFSATQNLTDGELYYIIHNGIRLTGMPAWGDAEKDEDSWKLVLFIRRLPELTAEEVREMERFKTVGFDNTTKFEKSGTAATVKDLKVGDRVVVDIHQMGDKLHATIVRFGAPQKEAPPASHSH